MKTPKRLAEDYAISKASVVEEAYLAGYQAAKDQVADVGKEIAEFMGKMPENFDTAEWKADWFTKRDCGEGKEHQVCWESFVTGHKSAAPQWISVKDRLPDKEDEYLAFGYSASDAARWIVVMYDPRDKCWYELSSDWDWTDDVTHWMPLPKPPKEEG